MNQIGRYEILAELGRGAMGVVYRARDSRIGREVAMKTIRLSDKFDETEAKQLRDRLFREAQSAGRLSHPGIVTIYDIDEEDGLAFITMELVDGRTLEELLKAKEVRDIGFVTNMLLRTAAALDYAHEREIIHRDIKPGNIMITKDGRVKITDFGIARVSSSTMTQTGVVMGTPSYMSPEQVRGETISGKSDQFSLAVVIYELLTGSKPFSGDGVTTVIFKIVSRDPPSPRELNPNLSDGVAGVILTALSKSSGDRYANCTEFAEAFATACDSTGSHIFAPADPSDTLLMQQDGMTGEEATAYGIPPQSEKSDGAKAMPKAPAPVSPDDLTVVDVAAKPKQSGSGSMAATPAPVAPAPVAAAPPAAGKTDAAVPAPAAPEPALPPRTATRTDPEAEPGGSKAWLGIVAAVLLIVGAAGFYLVNNPAVIGMGGPGAADSATADSGGETAGTADSPDTGTAGGEAADGGTVAAADPAATGAAPGGPSTSPASGSPAGSNPAASPTAAPASNPVARKAASTPALVAVNISSSVPGVQVAVDNNADFTCITPCSLEMPPGDHRAVARLAGYELKIESFKLGSDPLDINFAMRQQVSTVFISSDPSGAEILVDGKKLDVVTNARIDIPLGYHLITVRKGAAGTSERNVLMREGELRQLRFKLAPGSPPRGQVTFKSTPPGAQIILNDNVQSGVAPRELRIAPGNYRVTFSLNGHRPVIKEFEINEDETLTVEGALSSQN